MPVESQPKNPFEPAISLMRSMVAEPIQFDPQALDAAITKGDPRLSAGLVDQLQLLLIAQGPEVIKRFTPSIDRICLRMLDEIVFPSLLDDSVGFKDYLGRYIRMVKTPSVAPERSKSELALNGSLPDSIFQYYKEIAADTLEQRGSRDSSATDMRVLRQAVGIFTASQAALSFELVADNRLDRVLDFTIKLKSVERAHQSGFLLQEAESGAEDFVKDNRRLSCALVLSKLAQYILEDPGLSLLAADPARFTRTMREMAAPEPSDAVGASPDSGGAKTSGPGSTGQASPTAPVTASPPPPFRRPR